MLGIVMTNADDYYNVGSSEDDTEHDSDSDIVITITISTIWMTIVIIMMLTTTEMIVIISHLNRILYISFSHSRCHDDINPSTLHHLISREPSAFVV